MSVRVRFFAHLRPLFGARERTLDLVPGTTISQLLDRLADVPQRRAELFQEDRINPHLVIIRNGMAVRGADGLAAVLKEGDVVNLFPHLGGG